MNDWQVPMGREFSDEELERITKKYPHCPKCGEPAISMDFHMIERRTMWMEIDGSDDSARIMPMTDEDRCLVNVSDEADDSWVLSPMNAGDTPTVNCENGHDWTAENLIVRRGVWQILEEGD